LKISCRQTAHISSSLQTKWRSRANCSSLCGPGFGYRVWHWLIWMYTMCTKIWLEETSC